MLMCRWCETPLQMSFYTSCKSVARDIVSCCDSTRIDTQQTTDSPEFLHPSTTTKPGNLYDPRKAQRKGGHRLQTREHGCADTSSDHIIDRIFFYDTILHVPQAEKVIYRRVLLSFKLKIDAISDEIPRAMGLPIHSFSGKAVQLHNGKTATPIGIFPMRWQLYNGKKIYKTKFLVIKDSQFDMLLGRSSIKKYKLWEEDGDIERRLQYRC
ncbi:hypothetical protein BJX62DRAFT_207743 [Aspergillus germanicus]